MQSPHGLARKIDFDRGLPLHGRLPEMEGQQRVAILGGRCPHRLNTPIRFAGFSGLSAHKMNAAHEPTTASGKTPPRASIFFRLTQPLVQQATYVKFTGVASGRYSLWHTPCHSTSLLKQIQNSEQAISFRNCYYELIRSQPQWRRPLRRLLERLTADGRAGPPALPFSQEMSGMHVSSASRDDEPTGQCCGHRTSKGEVVVRDLLLVGFFHDRAEYAVGREPEEKNRFS